MSVDTRKFITGKPIELPYATFRFLTFEEYIDYQESLGVISLGTLNIYYNYKKVLDKPSEEEKEFLQQLKDAPLRQIIMSDKLFLQSYLDIFEKVIEFKEGYSLEEVFETDEKFMEVRKIVMDMNLAKEEKAFYNEELQEGIERGKQLNKGQGDPQTSEDIITCIVSSTSNSFDDVLGMSIYQAYAIYARVNSIKNYEAGVLYSTVSNEVKIEY